MARVWSPGVGKGLRSVGTAARPLEFHLGVWESLQWMCMQAGISSLFVFLVCSGQARWKVPARCLEWLWQPQFLSRNAPSSLDQSLSMTQIQSSTEASSPAGPQGCSQATADHSRGQGPKYPAQPIQAVPLPNSPLASSGGAGEGDRGRTAHPLASSRVPGPVDRAQSTPGQPQKKEQPISGQQRGGQSTAYPWWVAGSQVPGRRALCTALLRRALSW